MCVRVLRVCLRASVQFKSVEKTTFLHVSQQLQGFVLVYITRASHTRTSHTFISALSYPHTHACACTHTHSVYTDESEESRVMLKCFDL